MGSLPCLCCVEVPPLAINLTLVAIAIPFAVSRFQGLLGNDIVRRSVSVLSSLLACLLLSFAAVILALSNDPSLQSRFDTLLSISDAAAYLTATGVAVLLPSLLYASTTSSKALRRFLVISSCLLSSLLFVTAGFLVALSLDPALQARLFAGLCGMLTKPSPLDEYRCNAIKGARGKVLELGPGPGTNFRCFNDSASAITSWTAIEVNRNFESAFFAAAASANVPFPVDVLWFDPAGLDPALSPESLGTYDSVVTTHVLCSVDDHKGVLADVVSRALKVGGSYYFMEHVAAPEGSFVAMLQRSLATVVKVVANGCEFKDIKADVEETMRENFDVTTTNFEAPMPLPPFVPHISGFATKRR